MMKKNKVIFDCDVGCDDAVALIALLLNEDIDVIAITCVKGNIPVEDVVTNALKVSALCRKDIPVYQGCSKPMVRDLLKGRDYNTLMERIHMEIDGKEILIHEKNFDLPLPERKAEEKHACAYLIETLMKSEEKIDICAVGPLTNIGMALRLEPKITDHIGTIYIMGGGLYIGNRTPLAEANFYDDPEAAEIVLTSGAECLICPIEPCEEGATYDQEDLRDIKACNNEVSAFLAEELKGYIDRCNILFNTDIDSCCIYDYVAVAPLIDESVIIEKRKDIARVDISGGMADGQLVIDRRGMFDNDSKTEVIYHVDPEKIRKILLHELRNFH
jgi:inosine-uridine nucleoside N-ribohydrolase